jgi:hypothetical protein
VRSRRAGILSAVLAAAVTAPAAAGPEAGPGFAVAELPVDLQIASGVAELDGDLVFTDLGTGRVLWRRGGEPITLDAAGRHRRARLSDRSLQGRRPRRPYLG